VWLFTTILILFFLYRAIYSEKDDARFYCFEGVFEQKAAARVTGTVEKIDMSSGEEDSMGNVYLKNCQIVLTGDDTTYSLERLLVYPEETYDIAPGNGVTMTGTLREFETATNPGQFDRRAYYKEKGIYYSFSPTKLQVVSSQREEITYLLYCFRDRLQTVYQSCLPSPQAGEVSAMILGNKSLLDTSIKQLYQESGIGHLLAISGLHVTILGMALYGFLRRTGLHGGFAIFLSVVMVFLYGKMTGFSVSTSRAVIMMILSLLAQGVGRTYDGKNALAFAGILILLQHPFALYSCSFLLSFGAMGGVYVVYPVLLGAWRGDYGQRKEKKRRRRRWEKEMAARGFSGKARIWGRSVLDKAAELFLLSASIQLATLPVVLYFYYEVPSYGVIINLVVIPLASFVVLLSFLGGVAGLVFLPFGKGLLGSVYYILKFYEAVCLFFQKLPGHLLVLGQPTRLQMAGYYGVLFCLLVLLWTLEKKSEDDFRQKKTEREDGFYTALYHWGGILLPFCCLFFLIPIPSNSFSMTMLDVGQGECIYLHTPTGKNILIDGGSTSVSNVGQYRILPFLKSKAITTLDYVMATHGDEDHISGLEEMLSETSGSVKINMLLLPDVAEETKEEFAELVTLAEKNKIPVSYLSDGSRFQEGELSLTCLNPVSGFVSDSSNAGSLTFSLSYEKFSCLLTGDLEQEGQDHVEELLRSHRDQYGAPAEYTVLKVAHHGSKNSTSEEFLEQVSPGTAIISCGRNNRYGHPHSELLERLENVGARVMRTDIMGALRITVSEGDGGVLMESYLGGDGVKNYPF
jgi:competence protein ComEC